MNILLTGGLGYIGGHTAINLLMHNFNVVILDNLSNSQIVNVQQIEKITSKRINFIEGDIRDKSRLLSIFKEHDFDVVMHFAGLKAVAESALDPLKYYDNNIIGSINLFEVMVQNKIKNIIFSSSATVYGKPEYLPYDENHPIKPNNPYGRTKYFIEEILKDLSNSDPDWSVICLRYFNPVGAHESGLFGEQPKGTPNNLMPYILDVAKGYYPFVRIFGSDYPTIDGTGVRDYIHIMDLAEGHVCALNNIKKLNGWHAFNLGTGIGLSVLSLIKNFNSVNNLDIPYKFENKRPGDLPEFFASPEKAMRLLNWKATRNIFDICHSSWIWANQRK